MQQLQRKKNEIMAGKKDMKTKTKWLQKRRVFLIIQQFLLFFIKQTFLHITTALLTTEQNMPLPKALVLLLLTIT